ncbi:MAG TPA: LytR C-terminal domain-containing protein [Candidatus Acidoferrales bacterium]|nr:LytR C-terminal domain-containing protein [Candidatus Acidoferrales bacterium]
MSDESPFQGQPQYVTVKTSHKKRWIIIFFVVLLLVIAALGALYLLGSTAKHPAPILTNPVPTETMPVTPTPASSSATPIVTAVVTSGPSINPTALKVSVLNGSGVAGIADKMASALKTAGYTNVTTGNAKDFTYTGITIYAKKQEYLQQVKQDVTSLNSSVKITSGVDATIPNDVEVIVGK